MTPQAATAAARQQLLIGGQWCDVVSNREYEQRFPYTGDVVGTAAAATREDPCAAVEAAQESFKD